MKRTALLLAALNLSLAHAVQSATVTLNPTVTVSNVCATLAPGSVDINGTNLQAPGYPEFDYNALDGDGGGAEVLMLGIRCTAGTALKLDITASGAGSESLTGQTVSNSVNSVYTGVINLSGPTTTALKAVWRARIDPTKSTGPTSPDRYMGRLKFTAPDGQWGVPAGEYSGTLAITVSYN